MANFLKAGDKAPEFTLWATPDQTLSLKEFHGKTMLLIFYPADWSPVCSDELVIFNEALPAFRKYQTGLLGISVDGPWCHRAFAENRRIHFPLLSDFEPKGAIARKYGVYRDKTGICERALFLIDQDQTVAWSYLSPIGENPGADGALDALERLAKNL